MKVFIAIFCFISILAIGAAVWTSDTLGEFAKGIISLILGRVLGYLDQIIQHEYGSTKDSKDKTAIISSLTVGDKGGK